MSRTLQRTLIVGLLLGLAAAAGCVADAGGPGADHDEPLDFEVDPADGKADGVPATFNRHDVVGDDVFLDRGLLDVTEVQTFLEETPYGNTSWLATYTTAGGVSAAQAVIDAATAKGISPLVLLARMQVESGLVSKTVKPSQSRIDKIMGCGCPDGGGCSSAYRGFDKQMLCAAEVLRRGYDTSVDGSSEWRKGKTKRTLDPLSVTPVNHATAALYLYTPWVLQGSGGNWLVWNVTRKYVRHAEAAGLLDTADDPTE